MGFRKGLYYLTQLAVSRGKNCILGFRLKPHWFHQKLHTRIMDETTLVSNCILGFRMKPKWFQIYRDFYSVQKLEYAIFCETIVVSSKIRVCNLKPVWFHPESEYAIFVKPFWFHQKSEYAINQCRRRFFGLMAPPCFLPNFCFSLPPFSPCLPSSGPPTRPDFFLKVSQPSWAFAQYE